MFVEAARQAYPIVEAWLYGSRARGDQQPESDVDVAVILDGPRGRTSTVAIALADPAFDVMLEANLFVAALPIWLTEWEHPERHPNPRLIANIKRDGTPL